MEGFLFLLDMVVLILLLRAVGQAEKAGKPCIDFGLFAVRKDQKGKTEEGSNQRA